jgi:glycosyltransferase involved in cell wall biosynthesis
MEAASNLGIRATETPFVTFLDDDDTWNPLFLKRTIEHLQGSEKHQIGGVVTQSLRINEAHVKNAILEKSRASFNSELTKVSLADLAQGNRFAINAFLYRRKCLEQIGAYDESLPVLGDWHFNLRFISQFPIDVLAECLSHYHVRETSMEESSANTVVTGLEKHLYYQNLIRQKMISEDLKAQRVGIGLYMYLGELFCQNREQLNKRTRILSPLNKMTQFWKAT